MGGTVEISGEENQRLNNPALKLAGVMGLRGRLCLRCRARGSCEPPLFASLALLARTGVLGAGGNSIECLMDFEGASSIMHFFFLE